MWYGESKPAEKREWRLIYPSSSPLSHAASARTHGEPVSRICMYNSTTELISDFSSKAFDKFRDGFLQVILLRRGVAEILESLFEDCSLFPSSRAFLEKFFSSAFEAWGVSMLCE